MTRFNLSIAILACSVATSSIAAPDNVRYRLTQIVPDTPASTVAAADLNDRGQAVGFVQDASGRDHAFEWRAGTLTNLGPMLDPTSPRSRALANNDRGDILGFFFDPQSDASVNFLLRRGQVTRIDGLPGGQTGVVDINDREQVTGTLERRGFLWERGTLVQLPTLEGAVITQAASINNAGEIVGTSALETGPRATLWEDEQVFDLNDLVRRNDPLRPFVSLQDAASINDRGAIVATGRDTRAPIELRTYLLTPVR